MSSTSAESRDNTFDERERVELAAYESLSIRRAVLARILQLSGPGPDLGFPASVEDQDEFLHLHEKLAAETQRSGQLLMSLRHLDSPASVFERFSCC